eukprot:361586_1
MSLLCIWHLLQISYCIAGSSIKWEKYNKTLSKVESNQFVGHNINGDIYLFGGTNSKPGVWKWNGKTPMHWSKINNTPTIYFHSSCDAQQSISVANLVYFIGVLDVPSGIISGKVYIYNMDTEIFLSTNNNQYVMPQITTCGCTAYSNNNIYYIAGIASNNYVNTIQIFNITLQKWNTTNIPKLPISYCCSSCIGTKDAVYSFGGQLADNRGSWGLTAAIFKYNITTNNVSDKSISSLTIARSNSYAVMGYNNYIYIIGGMIHVTAQSHDPSYVQRVDIFDLNKEIILKHNYSVLQQGLYLTTAAMVNYSLFTFGGQIGNTYHPYQTNLIQKSNPMWNIHFNVFNEIIYPNMYIMFDIIYKSNSSQINELIVIWSCYDLFDKNIILNINPMTKECIIITQHNRNCSQG